MSRLGNSQLDRYDDALTQAFAPVDPADDYQPEESGYDSQTQQPDPGADGQDSWQNDLPEPPDVQPDETDTSIATFESGSDFDQAEVPQIDFGDLSGDAQPDQGASEQEQRDVSLLARLISSVQGEQKTATNQIDDLKQLMNFTIDEVKRIGAESKNNQELQHNDLDNLEYSLSTRINEASNSVHVDESFNPFNMGVILAEQTDDGDFTYGQLAPDTDGSLVDFVDGIHVTDDSDAAAYYEFADGQFALVPVAAINGSGDPVTRYYKISGGAGNATFMKVKTASNSNLIAIANTWDGTTLGSDDIPIKMAIPAKVGMTFHAFPVDHTAVNYDPGTGNEEVTWVELVGGVISSPTTIGDTIEGSESADSTTHSALANNTPLTENDESRVVYNESGDKKLYAFDRQKQYNSRGLRYATTAETRIIIDAASACPTLTAGF